MAMPDHNHPPHTDGEHANQHRKAKAVFLTALKRCVSSGYCVDVILQEIIEVLVQGALAHDRPISEVVANLIDTYEEVRDELAVVDVTLEPAEKPRGN